MPVLRHTTPARAGEILAAASRDQLLRALACITASALDETENGNDTAAVVYEQLGGLGITVE
jgi:hypothetical protein